MNYQQPYPQNYQPYPQYPAQQNYPPYPAGGGGYYPQQPQVIYQERPRSRWNDPNTCWLISLLTLCCGCLLGEALCDEQCCCCLIPCFLPRFGRWSTISLEQIKRYFIQFGYSKATTPNVTSDTRTKRGQHRTQTTFATPLTTIKWTLGWLFGNWLKFNFFLLIRFTLAFVGWLTIVIGWEVRQWKIGNLTTQKKATGIQASLISQPAAI